MSTDPRPPSADSSLVARCPSLGPSGILNLDKPAGPTSHDIVARVRRLIGSSQQSAVSDQPKPPYAGTDALAPATRNPKSKIQNPKSKLRVGHSGTLDPAATGVLLVLLGTATRLAEYLGDLPKRYEAVIRFGLRTDTQDLTGAPLGEADASFLTEAAVQEALGAFRGDILQTPPMVSAVKMGGKRLYELARRGETVERAARPVTIYDLRLEEFHPGREAQGRLAIACSSGTYVRTLCADLGDRLGCGAAMAELRRTGIGPFRVEDAVTLEQFEEALARGGLEALLLPPAAAVAHLPAVTVDAAAQASLVHGQAVSLPEPQSISPNTMMRVLDERGVLLAIGRWEGRIVPVKVLAAATGDDLRGGEEAERQAADNIG